jgi:hypothetical protein
MLQAGYMLTLRIELACILPGMQRQSDAQAAAVTVFVLIGIDAWLCVRTLGPGAH